MSALGGPQHPAHTDSPWHIKFLFIPFFLFKTKKPKHFCSSASSNTWQLKYLETATISQTTVTFLGKKKKKSSFPSNLKASLPQAHGADAVGQSKQGREVSRPGLQSAPGSLRQDTF
jgi:hypothetical protein